MTDDAFFQRIQNEKPFIVRRAVERLREGLFDPFAVQALTAREDQLKQIFSKGAETLAHNRPTHLCICGSYGQGKSHSLAYLRQQALAEGFAVSQMNLDPREVPFHDFRQVYRELMNHLWLPGEETSLIRLWKKWNQEQKALLKNNGYSPLDHLPEEMPHVFKSMLVALVQRNMELTDRQKNAKKHKTFRPREFPYILSNALNGEAIPIPRLRHALKYRQVGFYTQKPLACKGWEPYFQMVCSLSGLFRKMGFKGWVLLFDEGESIAQARITSRSKSYDILNQLFSPAAALPGLFPVFAFTDDFFMQVEAEEYERTRMKKEVEIPYFSDNYAEKWRNLNVYRLSNLSDSDWTALLDKLVLLHAGAYHWQPEDPEIQQQMKQCLKEMREQETRLKLKSLVEILDFFNQRFRLGAES